MSAMQSSLKRPRGPFCVYQFSNADWILCGILWGASWRRSATGCLLQPFLTYQVEEVPLINPACSTWGWEGEISDVVVSFRRMSLRNFWHTVFCVSS